jgi:hypothetical protein
MTNNDDHIPEWAPSSLIKLYQLIDAASAMARHENATITHGMINIIRDSFFEKLLDAYTDPKFGHTIKNIGHHNHQAFSDTTHECDPEILVQRPKHGSYSNHNVNTPPLTAQPLVTHRNCWDGHANSEKMHSRCKTVLSALSEHRWRDLNYIRYKIRRPNEGPKLYAAIAKLWALDILEKRPKYPETNNPRQFLYRIKQGKTP